MDYKKIIEAYKDYKIAYCTNDNTTETEINNIIINADKNIIEEYE